MQHSIPLQFSIVCLFFVKRNKIYSKSILAKYAFPPSYGKEGLLEAFLVFTFTASYI